MTKDFLVQLDAERNFLTRIAIDGSVHGSLYPSFAATHTYDEADRLARTLRDRGYELAVVTDKYGAAVTADNLDALREAEALPEFYSVKLDSHRFFVRLQLVQGRWQVIHDLRESNACGLRKEDAVAIVENLKGLGHTGAHAFVNHFYDESMISEVDQVWPEPVAK